MYLITKLLQLFGRKIYRRIVADDTPEALTETEGRGLISIEVISSGGEQLHRDDVALKMSQIAGVSSVEYQGEREGGACAFRMRTDGSDPRREIFEKAVQEDLILLHMAQEQLSLEETFRKLTLN